MCTIITTPVDIPYLGIRQILSWGVPYKGEDEVLLPQCCQDLTCISKEEKYSLLSFLMARKWSIACDILAAHPSLVAPWASNFLRDMVLGSHLSAEDFEVFCAHIFVLDLVQLFGIGRMRAFLKHFDL